MDPVSLNAAGHTLSTPVAADVERIYRLCQDPDIQRWTTVPVPYEREHAEQFVRDLVAAGWAEGTGCTWAIRDDDSAVIGMVGLDKIEGGSAAIGYWLGPDARGRGIATAAVRAVADFAFDELGLTRISWDAFVGNEASRRLAERCGFRIEGQVRGHYWVRGAREDAWLGTLYATDPR